jgi:hypothetical protein
MPLCPLQEAQGALVRTLDSEIVLLLRGRQFFPPHLLSQTLGAVAAQGRKLSVRFTIASQF